jgi:putative ABC transport system permease protein
MSGYDSQAAVNALHRRLQAQLAGVPGITGVGAASHLPFDVLSNWGYPYLTMRGQDPATATFSDYRSVSPGYLETIGARLVEGRFFTEADREDSLPVVIVDDLLAQKSWPGETALGKQIAVDPSVSGKYYSWAKVVGVVRHMRTRSLVQDLSEQVFMPIRLVPRPTSYVVSTAASPADLAPAIRATIHGVDPRIPISEVRPLETYLSRAKSTQRFTMFLAAAFAAVALALAFVGVFGLISYSASTRRYEFGVRLALGAQVGEIIRLVLRESLRLLAAGLIVGVAAAALVASLLESQLFGVTAYDVPTYLAAIVVIVAAGLLASWLPARKASATNPLDVIRT